MPALQHASATLRISGAALQPEAVSALLGVAPSRSQTQGLPVPHSASGRLARFGLWSLQAADTATADVDAQVAQLLDRLSPDLASWRALASRFELELFCGWFMGSGNEGVVISAATLQALGERGIKLGLDLYGPEQREV